MVFGLGDDNKVYLWNNQKVEWFIFQSLPPNPQDSKKQSIADSAKNEAEKLLGFRGPSIRSLLRNS